MLSCLPSLKGLIIFVYQSIQSTNPPVSSHDARSLQKSPQLILHTTLRLYIPYNLKRCCLWYKIFGKASWFLGLSHTIGQFCCATKTHWPSGFARGGSRACTWTDPYIHKEWIDAVLHIYTLFSIPEHISGWVNPMPCHRFVAFTAGNTFILTLYWATVRIVCIFRLARTTYLRTLECNILNWVCMSVFEKHRYVREIRPEIKRNSFACLQKGAV